MLVGEVNIFCHVKNPSEILFDFVLNLYLTLGQNQEPSDVKPSHPGHCVPPHLLCLDLFRSPIGAEETAPSPPGP